MLITQEQYERALHKYSLLKDANRTAKGDKEFFSLATDIYNYEKEHSL